MKDSCVLRWADYAESSPNSLRAIIRKIGEYKLLTTAWYLWVKTFKPGKREWSVEKQEGPTIEMLMLVLDPYINKIARLG